jgi:hypoxanthine-DNA glycosylase
MRNVTNNRVEGFPPIASDRSKVLILGTMPGELSLVTGQYYANLRRNIFWPIMGELFGARPALPYEKRVEILQSAGVAVWDVLQSCVRPDSLDESITEEVVNDFPAFFAKHPSIAHVFFNGGKAQTMFRRHVLPAPTEDRYIFTCLPSTSPAHAAMRPEAKMLAWSVIKTAL